jgi:uncharacterized protein (TIGR00255 family)
MTGYGYREEVGESSILGVELKAYNNRYLDINVNVPPSFGPLEPRIRDFVSSRVARGRVEVYVKARGVAEETTVVLDRENVAAYVSAITALRDAAGLDDQIRLSDLLRLEGILRLEKSPDLESSWIALEPVLAAAFAEFDRAREAEGETTRVDIERQIDRIRMAAEKIESYAPSLEDRIKSQIRERFQEVLGNEVDENRIYAETAVLLVKYSINEELVRLRAHLGAAADLLQSEEPVGKRLDFTCQELNREINTIGSKSVIGDVNQAVVEAKDALENIREQLRNVE